MFGRDALLARRGKIAGSEDSSATETSSLYGSRSLALGFGFDFGFGGVVRYCDGMLVVSSSSKYFLESNVYVVELDSATSRFCSKK